MYTPCDSLVFGGNFLHSFGIEKQLKIAQVEDVTKVPQKFRYPFFTEMLWYVLERYVHCLLGRTHLAESNDKPPIISPDRPHVHLTQQELHGLKAIVMYLHALPTNKKNVPELISNPIALINDVRTVVGLHRHDDKDLAITGVSVLVAFDDDKKIQRIPLARSTSNRGGMIGTKMPRPSPVKIGKSPTPPAAQTDKGGPRRRRTR